MAESTNLKRMRRRQAREACWKARAEYETCLRAHGDDEDECKRLMVRILTEVGDHNCRFGTTREAARGVPCLMGGAF